MVRETRNRRAVIAALAEWTGATGPFPVVRAPLRVCPLGAHIDHQGGTVTGLCLDRAVWLAFAPSGSRRVRVRSLDFGGETVFDLDSIPPAEPGDWGNFARGAALVLRNAHRIDRGLDAVLRGPLPIGGLSSSAAVGLSYLTALAQVNQVCLAPDELIHACRRIENDYLGVQSGLLDPGMIVAGRPQALTVLDCDRFEFDWSPTPPTAKFDLVVAYCGLSRALETSDYNLRVEQCGQAAAALLGRAPARLCEVDQATWAAGRERLEPLPRRRAEHYFGEMERVREGIEHWRSGDLASFGRLMTESGRSSVEQYECGGVEMTSLWRILIEAPGVLGARFSGAGFKGSCLALARRGCREGIAAHVAERYPAAQPHLAGQYELHFCRPGRPLEVL